MTKYGKSLGPPRADRLAANLIGVPDYRTLVDQKPGTAGELYRFVMDSVTTGPRLFWKRWWL